MEGMLNMEQIISICTVCVTFVLGILGLILNSMIQRKSNSIKMITQHRFDRRSETQKLASIIIKYSDPDMIACLNTDKERNTAIIDVIEAMSKLRSIYFRSYECDVRLLDRANDLKECLIPVIYGEPVSETFLIRRQAFIKEVDVYTATEWQRIKLETIGKARIGKNNLGIWEDDYQKTLNYYNMHNKKTGDDL